MTLTVDWIAIDCSDPASLARFWQEALGYEVAYQDEDEVLLGRKGSATPKLGLFKVPEKKEGKNRLHLDLRPDDQDAEVARLESLGATRVDIGQGDVTWVVMADPEGNEFCVLRELKPEEHEENRREGWVFE